MSGLDDELLTTTQVAKYFGVSKPTIYAWLNDGTLKGIKIGKGKFWRVPLSEVRKMAQEKYGDG